MGDIKSYIQLLRKFSQLLYWQVSGDYQRLAYIINDY